MGRLEEHRREVEAALAAVFGQPVALELTVDKGETAPPKAGGATAGADRSPDPDPEPDDEMLSIDDLVDAPPGSAPPSGIDRVTQAFPGAELLDDE
jgi:hypothetical protein